MKRRNDAEGEEEEEDDEERKEQLGDGSEAKGKPVQGKKRTIMAFMNNSIREPLQLIGL